jgi:hypothetical protein
MAIGADDNDAALETGTEGCPSAGVQHGRAAGTDGSDAWQHGIAACPAGAAARHVEMHGATSAAIVTSRTSRLRSIE